MRPDGGARRANHGKDTRLRHRMFRAAVESAMIDGMLSPRERAVLLTLQQQFGLTPRDVQRIEDEVAAMGAGVT